MCKLLQYTVYNEDFCLTRENHHEIALNESKVDESAVDKTGSQRKAVDENVVDECCR